MDQTRLIRALCAVGITLGMSAAVAQENAAGPEAGYAIQVVAASADPEGEITNGMDPPIRAINEPTGEEDYDIDAAPALDNLPELEVGST